MFSRYSGPRGSHDDSGRGLPVYERKAGGYGARHSIWRG